MKPRQALTARSFLSIYEHLFSLSSFSLSISSFFFFSFFFFSFSMALLRLKYLANPILFISDSLSAGMSSCITRRT